MVLKPRPLTSVSDPSKSGGKLITIVRQQVSDGSSADAEGHSDVGFHSSWITQVGARTARGRNRGAHRFRNPRRRPSG